MTELYVLIGVFPVSLGAMYALYCLGKYLRIDYDKFYELEKKVKEYENELQNKHKC